ncbi:MAG: hypothetical protein WCC87_05915 [Candidatus Korobacteraceae bacterium]
MSAAANESKTTQTTTTRLISEVTPAISTADTTVAQGVQTLTQVHQARLLVLTRKADSISAQYGASSAQAKAAKAAVTTSQATVARLSMLQNRVNLATPQAPAKGWAVYGHVYHLTLKPAAAYTVFFVDEQNAYQADIGFAYTAADGSFQITYTPSGNAASVPIFFEIVNDQAQPVYLSSTAFQPQTGAANYLDITLPAGEPVLGDPPAVIRAIAMPHAGAKSTVASEMLEKSIETEEKKKSK